MLIIVLIKKSENNGVMVEIDKLRRTSFIVVFDFFTTIQTSETSKVSYNELQFLFQFQSQFQTNFILSHDVAHNDLLAETFNKCRKSRAFFHVSLAHRRALKLPRTYRTRVKTRRRRGGTREKPKERKEEKLAKVFRSQFRRVMREDRAMEVTVFSLLSFDAVVDDDDDDHDAACCQKPLNYSSTLEKRRRKMWGTHRVAVAVAAVVVVAATVAHVPA